MIESLPEKILQKLVHSLLSDPSGVRFTSSGKRLQVLSPGRINVNEGPDFLEIAVLLDGNIVIGNAEFHKKSSDWISHNHQIDPRYNDLILHIVIEEDKIIPDAADEVLVLNKEELLEYYNIWKNKENSNEKLNILEDLQHFALLRILRKTSEARELLHKAELHEALKLITGKFLEKYFSGRKRPVYDKADLLSIIENISESKAAEFLFSLDESNSTYIPDKMLQLLKEKIAGEGAALRREIILNCILPIALAIADDKSRINLFLWFWSTPSLNTYGILKRKFSELPQNFIWQQQGMLEYLKEYGTKKNVEKEAFSGYGFGELLDFYYEGKTPYRR